MTVIVFATFVTNSGSNSYWSVRAMGSSSIIELYEQESLRPHISSAKFFYSTKILGRETGIMDHQISEERILERLQTIKDLQLQGSISESEIRILEGKLRSCYITRQCDPTPKDRVARYQYDTLDGSCTFGDLSIADGHPEGNFWLKRGNMWRCVSYPQLRSWRMFCSC